MNVSKEEVALLRARRDGVADARPKRVATTRKERDIQRAILDAAKLWKGVRLWKTGGGLLPLADGRRVRMGVVGVSDLVGWRSVRPGIRALGEPVPLDGPPVAQFIAIEVKALGKYPTREQQAFLEAVREGGGIAIVARSVEDVRRVLQP